MSSPETFAPNHARPAWNGQDPVDCDADRLPARSGLPRLVGPTLSAHLDRLRSRWSSMVWTRGRNSALKTVGSRTAGILHTRARRVPPPDRRGSRCGPLDLLPDLLHPL